jgi:hypothetical protein
MRRPEIAEISPDHLGNHHAGSICNHNQETSCSNFFNYFLPERQMVITRSQIPKRLPDDYTSNGSD